MRQMSVKTDEAARMLGLGEGRSALVQVRRMLHDGRLQGRKSSNNAGGVFLVTVKSIHEYLGVSDL
jgi:hypothetical protein